MVPPPLGAVPPSVLTLCSTVSIARLSPWDEVRIARSNSIITYPRFDIMSPPFFFLQDVQTSSAAFLLYNASMFCHVWESTLGLVPGNSRVDACHAFHRSATLTLMVLMYSWRNSWVMSESCLLLLLLYSCCCCCCSVVLNSRDFSSCCCCCCMCCC